jgi:hypothetical protein
MTNAIGFTQDGIEYFVPVATIETESVGADLLEIVQALEGAIETSAALLRPGAVATVEAHSPGLVDKFLREERHLQRVGVAAIEAHGYRWVPD